MFRFPQTFFNELFYPWGEINDFIYDCIEFCRLFMFISNFKVLTRVKTYIARNLNKMEFFRYCNFSNIKKFNFAEMSYMFKFIKVIKTFLCALTIVINRCAFLFKIIYTLVQTCQTLVTKFIQFHNI
jgi:hypothetical protein